MGQSRPELMSSFGVTNYIAPVSLLSEYYGTINSAEAAQAACVGILAAHLGAVGLGGSTDPIAAFADQFGSANKLRNGLSTLGSVYEAANLYFKAYPGCRFTHGPLEAIRELLGETDTETDDIDRIVIRVTPSSLQICGNYTTASSSFVEAQFSIPYVVASYIHDRRFGVDSFSPKHLSREAVHEFARDHIKVEQGWPNEDEVDLAATEIELLSHGDGRKTIRILNPKGSPANPLTDEDLRRKFLSLTSDVLGENATRLLDHILGLGVDHDITFAALLELAENRAPTGSRSTQPQ
jgi:2-methylcitrate dehydratase PrpD